jgi:hypothetical protein
MPNPRCLIFLIRKMLKQNEIKEQKDNKPFSRCKSLGDWLLLRPQVTIGKGLQVSASQLAKPRIY